MNIKKFSGGAYGANGYVISNNNESILIDSPEGTADKILKYLDDNKLVLKFIILTHIHSDHTGDLKKLRSITKAKVCIHGDDEKNQREINHEFGKHDEVKADVLLKDKDKINIGNAEFAVIHTPGHTPGSVCLYCADKRFLFSGDTLFAGAVGRTDFPLGDDEKMKKSLKRLLELPKDTVIYPGHGEETTIGNEE